MKAVLMTSAVLMATAQGKQMLGSHANHFPIVRGLGVKDQFLLQNFPFGKLGVGFKVDGDIYAGYQTDLFYLESTSNYLVANPILYLEAGLRTQFDLYVPFFDFSLKVTFEGFRYNPLDFTFLWSLAALDQYCYAT